jgi:hypothetical protein
MKRTILFLTLLLILSLACSAIDVSSSSNETLPQDNPPPQSEKRCGDKVCDGPEDQSNCPEDCSVDASATHEATASPGENKSDNREAAIDMNNGEYGILYQISENTVTSFDTGNTSCHALNFRQYLDGGYVRPDGNGNQILELQDYPTSMVASKQYDHYYYISSPNNPVFETFGFEIFDWDVAGQILWSAAFADNRPEAYAQSSDGSFPGGVTASPGNNYVLFPMTKPSANAQDQPGNIIASSINPFANDSSLTIAEGNSATKSVLVDSYNRQLFTSFADFSPNGEAFYTIARYGDKFELVKISLKSGTISSFTEAFPSFDWNQINWDEFFPQANDFAYGYFTISPDEKRVMGYKNIFTADTNNPCVAAASHNLWVFNLENNTIESFKNRPGYISDSAWKYDGAEIAFSIIGNAGCYPDYLDSRIDLFDRDGQLKINLVDEPKSKISNIGWSPDGAAIAFDIYGTDLIGRIKLIVIATRHIGEVINSQSLGYQAGQSQPATLLFADWVEK